MALTIYRLTGGKEAVMDLDDSDNIIFSHEALTSKDRQLLRARANNVWARKEQFFEYEGLEYRVSESAA